MELINYNLALFAQSIDVWGIYNVLLDSIVLRRIMGTINSEKYQDDIGYIFLGVYASFTFVKNMYASKDHKDIKKTIETLTQLITSVNQIQIKLNSLTPPQDKTNFHEQCMKLVNNTLQGMVYLLAGYVDDYELRRTAFLGGLFNRKSLKVGDGLALLVKSQEMFVNIDGFNYMNAYTQKLNDDS